MSELDLRRKWTMAFTYAAGVLTTSIGLIISKPASTNSFIFESLSVVVTPGLVLISLSFLVELRDRARPRILCTQIATMFVFLQSLPLLLEGRPHFTFQYLNYGYVDFILRKGSIDTVRLPYLNWPGSQLFGAFLALVTGTRDETFLMVAQIVTGALILASTSYVARRLFGNSKAGWMAIWLGTVIFIATPYFLPFTIGIVLGYFAIGSMITDRTDSRSGRPGLSLVVILMIFGLVITHLLTALIMATYLVYLAIVLLMQSRPRRTTLAILMVCLVLAYQFFIAETWTVSTFLRFMESWINFDQAVQQSYALGFSGSSAHSQLVLVRIGYVGIIALLALPALLTGLRSRLIQTGSRELVGWIGSSLAPSASFPYGGEIFSRAFATSLGALVLSIASSSRRLAPIVIALFLIAPSLSLTVAYGNLKSDLVSEEEPAASRFLVGYPSPTVICSLRTRLWLMHGIENRIWIEEWSQGTTNAVCSANISFLILSSSDFADYQYIIGVTNTTLLEALASTRNLIYDSGTVKIYH